jgi:hypothetical protein
MIGSRRSFLIKWRNLSEKLNQRKRRREIPEGLDVLNAQALGISGQILAFVAPHVEEEDSYYSEHSENEEELKEAYKTLYKEFEKLREGRK